MAHLPRVLVGATARTAPSATSSRPSSKVPEAYRTRTSCKRPRWRTFRRGARFPEHLARSDQSREPARCALLERGALLASRRLPRGEQASTGHVARRARVRLGAQLAQPAARGANAIEHAGELGV